LSLAAVRDLRQHRPPPLAEELEQFEVDVLAGFVLARASAGLTDATIRGDISHLEQLRAWYGRALWEMEPADADAYFGRVLRGAPSGTRLARAQALATYFEFLELRHKVELHAMTGRVVACPIDELNRPRGTKDARLRIPPRPEELAGFFAGWAKELASCRKFAPSARNYTAAKLMAEVGLRVNEVRNLDLADVKWELGPFGKLHVRHGKGARGSGPRERMVPLVNHADRTLRWFIQDVWGHFYDDHTRHGAPLLPWGTTWGPAMGFRRAGRSPHHRQDGTKSAADAFGRQLVGCKRSLPGQAKIGHDRAGETKLSVASRHGPGEPVGLFGRAGPGQGPVQGLLPKADGVLDGLIASDKFCWTRYGQLRLAWWRRPLRLRPDQRV